MKQHNVTYLLSIIVAGISLYFALTGNIPMGVFILTSNIYMNLVSVLCEIRQGKK